MPTNATVDRTTEASTGSGSSLGAQPSASAAATITTDWMPRTVSDDSTLAPTSRPRPNGVVPSRLRTPYDRSNPVAMARLANAVDSTARASTPGAR